MLLQNLTKENFFNQMQEKYPAAMKLFCAWIDDYKKENDWAVLFNSDSNWQDSNGKNAPAPKYHDLPLAMQYGIWLQFNSEYIAKAKTGSVSIGRDFSFENITMVIECSFSSIQRFEIIQHVSQGNYADWWLSLTHEQRENIKAQYHKKYQFKLIRDLSDSEIKLAFQRRKEYTY